MNKTVNMEIRGKISKYDLAYIAGLFDGEGHIFITRDMSRPKSQNYKSPVHIINKNHPQRLNEVAPKQNR